MLVKPLSLLLLPVLLIASGTASAQQAEPLCGDCGSTGRVPHPHEAEALELEKGALFCSVFMENDPEALGLDWIPCPKCLRPSARARAVEEFEREVAAKRSWLEGRRRAVDEIVKSKVDHLETEHFVIAFDLPSIKVGKQTFGRHAAMHLYGQRMEDLRARILGQFGMTDADTNGVKHHLYLFERQKTAMAMAPQVTGRSLTKGTHKISLLGIESHMVSWDNKEVIKNDEDRHQFLAHAVSHHIHDAIKDRSNWLFVRYGWVYEGLAHFQEIRDFGPPICWCTEEGGSFSNWQGKTWEANIKKAVQAHKQPSFQEVIRKSAGTLDPMEHQFAWSYIDYLMWLDPKKMHPMLRLMTSTQPDIRDVLQQAYGLSIGQFVDGWTEFVLSEYSMKARKDPYVRAPR
ncbi:MAG: hypothetical protein V2A76_12030 [Planctomycetota bacterium]